MTETSASLDAQLKQHADELLKAVASILLMLGVNPVPDDAKVGDVRALDRTFPTARLSATPETHGHILEIQVTMRESAEVNRFYPNDDGKILENRFSVIVLELEQLGAEQLVGMSHYDFCRDFALQLTERWHARRKPRW